MQTWEHLPKILNYACCKTHSRSSQVSTNFSYRGNQVLTLACSEVMHQVQKLCTSKAQLRALMSFNIIVVLSGDKCNATSVQLLLKCKQNCLLIVSFNCPLLMMKIILIITVPKTSGKEIKITIYKLSIVLVQGLKSHKWCLL